VTNLASANFAGLAGNERIKEKAVECLKRYGVGSCGPAGFYGTFGEFKFFTISYQRVADRGNPQLVDVHLELERDIAQFLRVPAAINYAQGFSAISSVIPAFCKRGDIVVADRGCNFAIQKGIQISRVNVKWYDHGDYESLERILEGIKKEDKKYRRNPTASRRFIVTEGIFENDGSMVNLPKVVRSISCYDSHLIEILTDLERVVNVQMELKHKYKYRLILDEGWSIGAIGKTGRGVTEVFDIPVSSMHLLLLHL